MPPKCNLGNDLNFLVFMVGDYHMIKSARFAILFVVIAMMSLVLTQAQDKKILVTAQEMGPDDIPTLDPALASDVPSVQIISQIFPELARINELTTAPEPGMATWESSEDGSVYTVTLAADVAWVKYNPETDAVEELKDASGNTVFVTADDFAFTMSRVGEDYKGVFDAWVSGVEVVDAKTLKISVAKPSIVFESVLGLWFLAASPKAIIESVGDTWIEPENIVTYGPFAVKSWNHGQDITLIKNPFFAGVGAIPVAKLDEVQFRFLDEDTQVTAFEAGEIDASEVAASQIERIKADPVLSAQLYEGPGTCTYYYGFNVTREPFNDARAVKAFSMAIDRALITEEVTGRGERPAGFFTLPTLNAAPLQENFMDNAAMTDATAAKALWDEYLASVGKTNADFALTILHNNSNLHASIAQAIQAMWKETLGVEVQIAAQDFGVYLEQRRDADIYRAAWCFDYPDTNNYLFDVFHSSVDPDGGFNNAAFDALVEEAAVEPDTAKRIELYAQAEKILVDDAAAIAPIYYYVSLNLTSDRTERTYSVIGREYYEKWDIK
jgi:oligopeptide transport system substrate-binding protein